MSLKMVYCFTFTVLLTLFCCSPAAFSEDDRQVKNSGGGDNPQAKNGRILGIDILQFPKNGSFDSNLQIAVDDLHINQVQFSMDWNQLEPSLGNHDLTLISQLIGIFWDKPDMKVSLTLRPVDTAGITIPSLVEGQLSSYDFKTNPALIIARFNTLLAKIYNHKVHGISLNDKIHAIYIGNEINFYLGEDEDKWRNYITFYKAVSAKVKELWGDSVQVSTIGTYYGLLNPRVKPMFTELYQASDVLAMTYYPQNDDFTVRSPDIVEEDFGRISGGYDFKPIVILECGYQSSTVCNSSEEKQALFIKNMFTAWDKYQAHIRQIDISWLFDISEAAADQSVIDYNMKGTIYEEACKHYLWSLGLRTYEGREKAAYIELKKIIAQRGW